MKRCKFGLIVAVMAAPWLSASFATSAPDETSVIRESPASMGTPMPDVWVCNVSGGVYWGAADGRHGLSAGTLAANAGNVNLNWVDNNAQHPVIAQNMYRLRDGVLEQVGMSWVKHGFCAVQQAVGCGSCTVSGGCLSFLKPGCADPYDAALNGTTSRLGPRSEVNPTSGVFPWPHAVGNVAEPAVLRSRLQVKDDDLQPALNPGARWFIEAQYVHPQDAQANLDNNNATWREVNVAAMSMTPMSTFTYIGSAFSMSTMIEGWAQLDPDVQLSVIDASDGRFTVASRVTELGGGQWSYEYAVHNMNSHRAAGSFAVPVAPGVSLSEVAFHDVDYHSGEIFDGTDWAFTEGAAAVNWSTVAFDINPNANALRWGTMYNFRFVANAAPVTANATLGFFRPGAPSGATAAVMAPGAPLCASDLTGDGVVNGSDLASLLADWGPGGGAGDLDGDGDTDGADLATLLSNWGDC